MLKKYLVVLMHTALLLCVSVSAQETELAANSTLTGVDLPGGAMRVNAQSVPADITNALAKLVAAAGEGKIKQGDAEVLAWMGESYRKSNAPNLMRQVQSNLQAKGWTYEVSENNDEVTFFSVLREHPKRSGVLGFFATVDDALVLAWTEILPAAGGAQSAVENDARFERIENASAQSSGSPRQLVGTWTSGGMSTLLERNTVTGSTTPLNGSTFKYVFTSDGRFESIGLMQSTVYGCTTSLFNDKRGRFEVEGSRITLIPSKNFWRNTYSCSPNSNKERDYTLERETYEWRTKTDEYGKLFICLANAKGESCYRRAE